MRHVRHYLRRYDKYIVAPAGCGVWHEGFTTLEFPRKFFGSAAAHNHINFWPSFYRTFADYEYVFLYHLDSLVFSDDFLDRCRG